MKCNRTGTHHPFQHPKGLGMEYAEAQPAGFEGEIGLLAGLGSGAKSLLISCNSLKTLEMAGETALYTRQPADNRNSP
jgi:hypothetical protein